VLFGQKATGVPGDENPEVLSEIPIDLDEIIRAIDQ
jgi:hypothetical protein